MEREAGEDAGTRGKQRPGREALGVAGGSKSQGPTRRREPRQEGGERWCTPPVIDARGSDCSAPRGETPIHGHRASIGQAGPGAPRGYSPTGDGRGGEVGGRAKEGRKRGSVSYGYPRLRRGAGGVEGSIRVKSQQASSEGAEWAGVPSSGARGASTSKEADWGCRAVRGGSPEEGLGEEGEGTR
jgi:hypothetical protein